MRDSAMFFPDFGSQAILDAWDKQDVDAFTEAVFQFDQITKLDAWKTQILLKSAVPFVALAG